MEQVRIQDRGDQVVRGADRMDISREMEVDLFHRKDLGVTASRRPAFRPEHGSEGRLADRDDRLRADPVQRLAQADRRQGLAFPVAGRCGARHEDELALAGLAGAVHCGEADLCDVVALSDEVLPREAKVRGDIDDRSHRRALSNLDVGDHGGLDRQG